MKRFNLETQEWEEQHELPKNIQALELLRMVYRGEIELPPQQFRAACEALPFENPKLGAVATTALNGKDFATMLEKAIKRSSMTAEEPREAKQLRLIEGGKEQIETQALDVEVGR
jgi:hypothetical protein